MKKTIYKIFILALCIPFALCSGCVNNNPHSASSEEGSSTSSNDKLSTPKGEALTEEEEPFEEAIYTQDGVSLFDNETAPLLSFDEAKSFYGEKSINILGDSITHGQNSGKMYNASWVSLFKNSVNKQFNSKDVGYVSVKGSIDYNGFYNEEIHKISHENGAWGDKWVTNTPGFHNVYSQSSEGAALLISIDRNADQIDRHINGFYVYYVSGMDSGGFDVTVNGIKVHSVAAGGPEEPCARTKYIAIPDNLGNELEIRIIKTDNKLVTLTGMYYANAPEANVSINNYSYSGMALVNIDDDFLLKICKSNYLILTIGYNDAGNSKNLSKFISKLEVISNACKEYGTTLIVADYLWPRDNNPNWASDFKIALVNCAKNSGGYYLDSTVLSPVDTNAFLSDIAHPTPLGHKLMARRICHFLSVPFTSDLN